MDAPPQPAVDAGIHAADSGITSAADAGASTIPCDAVTVSVGAGTDSADAGAPPDGGLTYSPGPTPTADQQSGTWVPTGAASCDGLIPGTVPPRLAWTAPGTQRCFEGDPVVDGAGNLTFAFDNGRAFFPADGSAGFAVTRLSLLGTRPSGFFRKLSGYQSMSQWVFAVAPDGSDQGVVRNDSDPDCKDFIYFPYALTPDPRGGYIESRIHAEFSNDRSRIIRKLELRWVDYRLGPRTPWLVGPTWDYGYNVYPEVHVDLSGNALAMLFFDPPMSMPCHGAMTSAVWASDSGSVVVFAPVTPTYQSPACDKPQFAGFGSAVVLQDGGIAFHHPRGTSTTGYYLPSVSGWYVRYPTGSGAGTEPPAWLNDYEGTLTHLAGGGAYFGTRRDPTDCTRTAVIMGPTGQLCASLPLEGSEGCDAVDQLSPDGTLALHQRGSCSVRWWPRLGGRDARVAE